MMRLYVILTIAFGTLPSYSHSQTTDLKLKAVVLTRIGGHSVGDTVYVLGGANTEERPHHYIIRNTRKGPIWVAGNQLKFLDTASGFWRAAWFKEAAGLKIIKPDLFKRNPTEFRKYSREFVHQLASAGLLYKDITVEDYLQRLILRIHDGYLFHHETKLDREASWRIYIRNTLDKDPQVFPDGTIIVSIKWLLDQKTETVLMKELAELMSHAILQHAYTNYNSFVISNSFRYDIRQQLIAQKYANAFMEQLPARDKPDTTEAHYVHQMSPIKQYVAFRHYGQDEYAAALTIVDELIAHELAHEELFYMKARIYRMLYDTEATNLKALGLLVRAEEIGTHNLIEIPAEKGLLYLRLGDYVAARQSFETYLQGQMALNDDPEAQKWAREMIWRCAKLAKRTE